MSKIVNNPADRKAIIWSQSHLSKLLMFITLLCFFYILVFFLYQCLEKTFFVFFSLRDFEGRTQKTHASNFLSGY